MRLTYPAHSYLRVVPPRNLLSNDNKRQQNGTKQRGRRGGGLGGARRPAAAPPARRPETNTTPAPMQQQSGGGGMLSGIGSTIAQGMAFGTGSAIAHRAVGAAAGALTGGGGEAPVESAQPAQSMQGQPQGLSGPCADDKQMFYECLQINRGDQQACSFLYDQLKMCQANQTQFG